MSNVVKAHEEVIGYLNFYGVDTNDYCVGEYSEGKVCVIDELGGYLIFDGKEDSWLNQTQVYTPEDVAKEIRRRVIAGASIYNMGLRFKPRKRYM